MNLLFISFLLNGDYHGLYNWMLTAAILACLPQIAAVVDLITGILASKRLGIFRTTSYGLRKTVSKCSEYILYFFLLLLLDGCLSFFITFPILCVICALAETLIEVVSIRENLKKGRTDEHDPIDLMQSIATAYGEDKASKIIEIIKDKANESKSDTNQQNQGV
jgi:hypothetical protein